MSTRTVPEATNESDTVAKSRRVDIRGFLWHHLRQCQVTISSSAVQQDHRLMHNEKAKSRARQGEEPTSKYCYCQLCHQCTVDKSIVVGIH